MKKERERERKGNGWVEMGFKEKKRKVDEYFFPPPPLPRRRRRRACENQIQYSFLHQKLNSFSYGQSMVYGYGWTGLAPFPSFPFLVKCNGEMRLKRISPREREREREAYYDSCCSLFSVFA